jgi:hypothetical protein
VKKFIRIASVLFGIFMILGAGSELSKAIFTMQKFGTSGFLGQDAVVRSAIAVILMIVGYLLVKFNYKR